MQNNLGSTNTNSKGHIGFKRFTDKVVIETKIPTRKFVFSEFWLPFGYQVCQSFEIGGVYGGV